MKLKSVSLLSCIFTASCVSSYFVDSFDSPGALQFVEPTASWRDRQGNCLDGQLCWSSLSQDDVRNELLISEASTAIYERNESGSLSYLGAAATVGRGEYRIDKYVTSYRNEPCVLEDESLGLQRVGVGVRVAIDVVSRSRKVDLGSLIALGVAAEQNKINGRIRIRSWGVNSSNRTLNALISTANVNIDEDGIQDALAALTIGEALLDDDDDTQLSPLTFAIVERSNGACRNL